MCFVLLYLFSLATRCTASTSTFTFGKCSQVVTKVLVYENPVYIRTNVLSNTTFEVNPQLTITVQNAPTNLDFTTTYTSRMSSRETLPVSATISTSIASGVPFVLTVMNPRRSKQRREAGTNYLGIHNRITSLCSDAGTFAISNGQLLWILSNGTTLQYSAPANVNFTILQPTTTPGPITTSFSVGRNGILQWVNTSFFNGNALFCVLPDGTLIAVFSEGGNPIGCVFVDLYISDLNVCQSNLLPRPSGPTGPTGPIGPSGVAGPAGPQGIAGPIGPQGVTGPTGVAGPAGPQGIAGPIGPQGVTGPTGVAGAIGPTGVTGAIGPTGIAGPAGPQGIAGPIGPQGVPGPSGVTGPIGPTGVAGPIGPQGVTGPIGPTGLRGLPGIAYSWLGCFYQTGLPSVSTGKVLSSFQTTYTTNINAQCSAACLALGTTFFGTVNNGTTSGDCYCGNTLNYVTVTSLTNGQAPDNNCALCNSGGGECGIYTSNTIAIFSKAF